MPADVSQFLAAANAYRANLISVVTKAVTQFGAFVVGEAQELCPKDTGALAASASWSQARMVGNDVVVEIGFNTVYAVFVHENLSAHHDPPTSAKFLEIAVRVNADSLNGFVAAAVRAA